MCLKLLSKLLTKKDDMPKPNEFVYSSDYRQPYIYEVIEQTVTVPATNITQERAVVSIPNPYQHRPLTIGYASTDPDFTNKVPIGENVWWEDATTLGGIDSKTCRASVEAHDDRIEFWGTSTGSHIPSKTIYFRVFLINRLNDSVPGKRQIIPKGNFNLNTDYANLQIYKEGPISIPANQGYVRIPHDLGYVPVVMCWMENDHTRAHPEDLITDYFSSIAYATKDYVDIRWDDSEDLDYYYMILTERVPDGQSS
jgi:hypothetical protein